MFMELSVIEQIVKMSDTGEVVKLEVDEREAHENIEEVYKDQESFWDGIKNENLLNWNNPLIRSAIFFIKLGCFEFAEIVLADYTSSYGFNINNLYLHAVIQGMEGNFLDAIACIDRISSADIGNHQVNYEKLITLKILMLLKLKDFKSAETLHKALKLVDSLKFENFLPNFMLGQHFLEVNDNKSALSLFESAFRIFPAKITAMELGKCFQNLNMLDQAEKCFQNAINFDQSNSHDAWQHLHQIYMKQNRTELVNLCIQNLNYF